MYNAVIGSIEVRAWSRKEAWFEYWSTEQSIKDRGRIMFDATEIIEEFDGIVDCIDGDVAYVTLTAKETGEILLGEYPAAKLAELGINERRRFKCNTVARGECVEIEMLPVPDREISAEEELKIRENIRELLGEC